jgi:signal transduction histidine kinase
LDQLAIMQWVQALLFTALAVFGVKAYLAQRSRPTAYVAAAFVALAFTTLGARIEALIDGSPELLRGPRIAAVAAFPWLLAAFAWSFRGRLPRWLKLAGLGTAFLAAVALALRPTIGVSDGSGVDRLFLAALLIQWVLLSGATAAHLWRAGSGQRVVRARTRLLAGGAVALAVALLVAGTVDRTQRPSLAFAVSFLAITAALLFAAGVAPPPVLRWYWRRLPSQRMHQMQTALVAASTPDEVAHAVTPVLGDTFGAGAVCADHAGRIVAHHGMGEQESELIVAQLADGDLQRPDIRALDVEGWHLAVQTSPYAPLFGEDERDLLARFGLQFRLALQRAQLYVAHERDRAELERSSAEMQAMLVGLSHDLRSPAVTISTYASLLREARDDDDRAQMIEGINDSSAYLDRLVDGLLELSRIGRSEGEPEAIALDDVIDGVGRRLAATHPAMTIAVTTPLPTICVDRLRIEQVVDNLLGNAAKHGGRDDLSVGISWEPHDAGGILVLADDGRGIPEGERESVFGLFRRGSGAQVSGSGVGLGLVRRIVESYGGRIRFAPSELGARVELTLPQELLQPDGETTSNHPREVTQADQA